MTKPKILQICFGEGYAGSAKMAIVNSFYLQKMGYEIGFIVSENSLTGKRTIECGLNTKAFNSSLPFKELFEQVCGVFEEFRPDFVICNHSLDRKIGIKLRSKYKKTFTNIAYRHNMSESFPVIGSIIYNLYYDYSIACSAGVGRSLTKSGILKKKVKVVHYGIELPENIKEISGESVRKKYNFEGKIVIGNSAWFHKERKGFDILFKAFSALEDKYVLMVIGIPQEKQEEVYAYASEFGIDKDRIILPGYVENTWEYYKAMDIFVFPSRSEGFPISPLEAGAAGLPIIATDIPGTNEFIFNGKTGLLVSVQRPEELVNAILKLNLNMEYGKRMGQEAYNSIIENYTAEKYAERLDKLFSV